MLQCFPLPLQARHEAPLGRPQYGDSSTIFMVNTAVSTSTE